MMTVRSSLHDAIKPGLTGFQDTEFTTSWCPCDDV